METEALKREKDRQASLTPVISAAAPGVGMIDFQDLPSGTMVETIPIVAADGMASRAVLYTRGHETAVACVSHPRGDMSRHYVIPFLLDAGFAVCAQQCRGLNNDIDCVHEQLVQDLAASISYLKVRRGFNQVIGIGNSGGGGLYVFYQSQACLPSADRIKETPAGDPCDLGAVDIPALDAIILLAAHPGQGAVVLNAIDPSVTDETDPFSCDPDLDMYNPANGFREPPQPSQYQSPFIERYRAAQKARVARLDVEARSFMKEIRRYKEKMAASGFEELPLDEKNYISRRALFGPYMTIYRTQANLAYCDPSLYDWKSTRTIGSNFSTRPDRSNYSYGGLARTLTPRAWLSTWSGLSSNANIIDNIKGIETPLFILCCTADAGCYPVQSKQTFEASPAKDKEITYIDAGHYLYPIEKRPERLAPMLEWMKSRFI